MVLEIIGYIGSALVVISMLMSSIIKLRVINIIGSVVSGVYAVICGAFPLALMNACLIVINLFNLWKLSRQKVIFDMITDDSGNGILRHFLHNYREDIREFFPDFDAEDKSLHNAFIVCMEGVPVGVLLGDASGDTLDIRIDYSTPTYRDCSVGKYLYSRLPEQGIRRLRFTGKTGKGHEPYLRKMGFIREGNNWTLSF